MSNFTQRENLKTHLLMTLALILLGGSLFALIYGIHNLTKGTGITYNCSIAEISPDIPLKVKEECRKIRAENFKENLQKPK